MRTFDECEAAAEKAGCKDAFDYFLWNETPWPFSDDPDSDARKALAMCEGVPA